MAWRQLAGRGQLGAMEVRAVPPTHSTRPHFPHHWDHAAGTTARERLPGEALGLRVGPGMRGHGVMARAGAVEGCRTLARWRFWPIRTGHQLWGFVVVVYLPLLFYVFLLILEYLENIQNGLTNLHEPINQLQN